MEGRHSSLRCFEASGEFIHIPVTKVLKYLPSGLTTSISMLETPAKGLQLSRHISAMGREPCTDLSNAAPLRIPVPPKPFLGIFIISSSVGPREGPETTHVVR